MRSASHARKRARKTLLCSERPASCLAVMLDLVRLTVNLSLLLQNEAFERNMGKDNTQKIDRSK